jgi:hypothetical protein
VLLFILASVSAFYGTRLSLPIVTSYGRGTLNTLPATLTFALPLFSFIMIWLYTRTDVNSKRLKLTFIYSLTMMIVAIFNIILILLVVTLLYNGDFIVGVMTPLYPLDLFLFNIVFLLIGIASLFFNSIGKKNMNNSDTEGRKHVLARYKVLEVFFILFATYFFGEVIFGYNELMDGFLDPNLIFVIPVHLSFLLLTLEGIFYIVYVFSSDEHKLKRGFILVLILLGLTFLLFLWILVGLIINPYFFSESMQFEFAIGYAIKIPLGIFIVALWVIIPALTAIIVLAKRLINKSKAGKTGIINE